jgi:hypothetical protein
VSADELRELVEFCRHHEAIARDRFERVVSYAGDSVTPAERVHTAILLSVRARELELWTEQLQHNVARLRELVGA